MIRFCFFLLVFLGLGVYGVALSQDGVMVPPKGSTFTYRVMAKGQKAATVTLWQEPGDRLETHTYLGVIKGFVPKIEGLQTPLPPRNCLHFQVTRPSQKGYTADFYYELKGSSIRLYLEKTSVGGLALYKDPLPVMEFPFEAGKVLVGKSMFYLKIPDTGIMLMRRYRSKDFKSDTLEAKITVQGRETIRVQAGEFQGMKTLGVFQSQTGGFLSSAKTKVEMERFWSKELRYFVQEKAQVRMDAAIDAQGTVERELIGFSLAGGR